MCVCGCARVCCRLWEGVCVCWGVWVGVGVCVCVDVLRNFLANFLPGKHCHPADRRGGQVTTSECGRGVILRMRIDLVSMHNAHGFNTHAHGFCAHTHGINLHMRTGLLRAWIYCTCRWVYLHMHMDLVHTGLFGACTWI